MHTYWVINGNALSTCRVWQLSYSLQIYLRASFAVICMVSGTHWGLQQSSTKRTAPCKWAAWFMLWRVSQKISTNHFFLIFFFLPKMNDEGMMKRWRNDFNGVLEKYFVPRRNVIHDHACFHQRVGEKAVTFMRALYELLENYELVWSETWIHSQAQMHRPRRRKRGIKDNVESVAKCSRSKDGNYQTQNLTWHTP